MFSKFGSPIFYINTNQWRKIHFVTYEFRYQFSISIFLLSFISLRWKNDFKKIWHLRHVCWLLHLSYFTWSWLSKNTYMITKINISVIILPLPFVFVKQYDKKYKNLPKDYFSSCCCPWQLRNQNGKLRRRPAESAQLD